MSSVVERSPLKKPNFLERYLITKMERIYRRDKFEIQKPIMKFLTSNWFMEREIISFENYRHLSPLKLKILKEEEVNLKYSYVNFFDRPEDRNIYVTKGFHKYFAEFIDIIITGSSDLIVLNGKYALYDLKFLDTQKAFDYTDEAIKLLKENQAVLEVYRSTKTIEKGIFLVGNYSANYYHFVIEIISRFESIAKMKLDKSIPIIMDNSCWEIPQLKELICYFNKEDRDILRIERGIQYKVAKLYYPSTPNIIPPNYKNITKISAEHNLFDTNALQFIRDSLLDNKSERSFPKRLFISRKNASGRRQYNESQILEVLTEYGFSVFYPEEYSALEQVAIFNQAEFIIGATGAAFTNLLFCNAGCKVLCLTNYDLNVSIFCTICKIFGIELTYIYDESLIPDKDSDVHADFNIDINKFKKVLQANLR